jgi:hypothetical protein
LARKSFENSFLGKWRRLVISSCQIVSGRPSPRVDLVAISGGRKEGGDQVIFFFSLLQSYPHFSCKEMVRAQEAW